MGRTIDRYEAVTVDAGDRVLVHSDVGLHNLALDPETDTVNGIFDYDGAAWADRHTTSAISLSTSNARTCGMPRSGVRPATGRTVDRGRIVDQGNGR
jgi:aminoglycoside phosphotransferase (APT) family kinase protein